MIAIMSGEFIDQLIVRCQKQRSLDEGCYLFHQGDEVKSVFVVGHGLIELSRTQIRGSTIILQRAVSRTFLAEASVYSANYHCDAIIRLPTVLYEMPRHEFLQHLHDDREFSSQWAKCLAVQVQSSRFRSEVMALKTVAERLDGWLNWNAGKLPEKGNWKNVASQIGVSPEALYRELARRR